jgi:cholesterol oxidase
MWPNKGELDSRPVQGQPYKKVSSEFPHNPVVPKGVIGELIGDI